MNQPDSPERNRAAMGRTLSIVWKDDEDTLLRAFREESGAHAKPRLHALWLLRRGMAMAEVASVLGVPYGTVQRWGRYYREGGLEGVRSRRGCGRGAESRTTPEQQQAIVAYARTTGFVSAREAARWVKEKFDIEYRPRGMDKLLRRLDLAVKVPRPMSLKADPRAREAWKKGGSGRSSEMLA